MLRFLGSRSRYTVGSEVEVDSEQNGRSWETGEVAADLGGGYYKVICAGQRVVEKISGRYLRSSTSRQSSRQSESSVLSRQPRAQSPSVASAEPVPASEDAITSPPPSRPFSRPERTDLEKRIARSARGKLDLHGLALTELPASSLRYCDRVEEVLLPKNLLRSFEAFSAFRKVQRLDISYNNLTQCPRELRDLVSLEDLSLRGNQLVDLPSWIAHLPHLKRLDAALNQIESLPEAVEDMLQLEEVLLDGNPCLQSLAPHSHLSSLLRQRDVFREKSQRRDLVRRAALIRRRVEQRQRLLVDHVSA
eukprot:gene7672-8479_t